MHFPQLTVGDATGLETALLRRSLGGSDSYTEACNDCQREMLIGERVYEYETGALRCELCRHRAHSDAVNSHTVHGPAFGHSIRVIDRRPSRRAA
jgi:hypothetical protein